jgi:hypothetical protein
MYKYPYYLKFLIVILFVATLFYAYYYFNNIFREGLVANVVKELSSNELSLLGLNVGDISTIKGYNLTTDQLTAMYKLFNSQLTDSANSVNQKITDLVSNVAICNNNLNGNPSLNIKGAIPLNNELKSGLQTCSSELLPLQSTIRDFNLLIAAEQNALK